MSAPGMNGAGLPPQFGGVERADPDAVTNALLWAVQRCAEKASSAQDTREAAEALKAALAGAQAIVVLDPGLSQAGVPLEHEMALEQLRQDGMERLERARQAAAAPTPKKRRLNVQRDQNGRMAGITEE